MVPTPEDGSNHELEPESPEDLASQDREDFLRELLGYLPSDIDNGRFDFWDWRSEVPDDSSDERGNS